MVLTSWFTTTITPDSQERCQPGSIRATRIPAESRDPGIEKGSGDHASGRSADLNGHHSRRPARLSGLTGSGFARCAWIRKNDRVASRQSHLELHQWPIPHHLRRPGHRGIRDSSPSLPDRYAAANWNTANMARCGSVRIANRPVLGISRGGTMTLPPSCFAWAVLASQSAT